MLARNRQVKFKSCRGLVLLPARSAQGWASTVVGASEAVANPEQATAMPLSESRRDLTRPNIVKPRCAPCQPWQPSGGLSSVRIALPGGLSTSRRASHQSHHDEEDRLALALPATFKPAPDANFLGLWRRISRTGCRRAISAIMRENTIGEIAAPIGAPEMINLVSSLAGPPESSWRPFLRRRDEAGQRKFQIRTGSAGMPQQSRSSAPLPRSRTPASAQCRSRAQSAEGEQAAGSKTVGRPTAGDHHERVRN